MLNARSTLVEQFQITRDRAGIFQVTHDEIRELPIVLAVLVLLMAFSMIFANRV